ncbi:MAG: hypothetical protein Q8K58_11225 [Acidimicrobiales bacterium]|nr:hypothetical protein [Acidimicrobiales bacterium]
MASRKVAGVLKILEPSTMATRKAERAKRGEPPKKHPRYLLTKVNIEHPAILSSRARPARLVTIHGDRAAVVDE